MRRSSRGASRSSSPSIPPGRASRLVAGLAVRRTREARPADQGPLPSWRGWPRQDHADGCSFFAHRAPSHASGARISMSSWPTCTTAPWCLSREARRPAPGAGQMTTRSRLSAPPDIARETWLLVLRRVARDRHRRRDDPGPAVRGAVRARRGHGGDVERAAERALLGGLNRALFLPFIAVLEKQHMDVVRVVARADFRLEKLAGVPVWYVPADRAADAAIDAAWRRSSPEAMRATEQHLALKGRDIRVPPSRRWALRGSRLRICARSRSSALDYLRIAHEFHTIVPRSYSACPSPTTTGATRRSVSSS